MEESSTERLCHRLIRYGSMTRFTILGMCPIQRRGTTNGRRGVCTIARKAEDSLADKNRRWRGGGRQSERILLRRLGEQQFGPDSKYEKGGIVDAGIRHVRSYTKNDTWTAGRCPTSRRGFALCASRRWRAAHLLWWN
jgi:hypothetical protein